MTNSSINTMGQPHNETSEPFDSGKQFDSVAEAVELILQQTNKLEALIAIVKANC